ACPRTTRPTQVRARCRDVTSSRPPHGDQRTAGRSTRLDNPQPAARTFARTRPGPARNPTPCSPGRTPAEAAPPMADTPPAGSLYLLDAHGLIFQMFHGIGPMSAPDGRPTNAVFGVTRSLMSLYDRGADYLIAALDHAEPTFRVKLDGNYKAHREPPPDDLL